MDFLSVNVIYFLGHYRRQMVSDAKLPTKLHLCSRNRSKISSYGQIKFASIL